MEQPPPTPPGSPDHASQPGDPPDPEPAGAGAAPRATWGIWEVIAGIAMSVVIFAIAGSIILAALGDEGNDHLLATQAIVGLTLIGVAYGFARSEREVRPVRRQLGIIPFGWRAVGLMGLAVVGYFVFIALYAGLFFDPEQEDIAQDLGADESTLEAIFVGILLVGLAPAAEEVFFRGFVYGGLRESMPIWPAMVISGALFGAVHFGPGDAAVVGQLAVLGTIFAWLYERTGSLGPPILLHMLNNAVAFIYLLGN